MQGHHPDPAWRQRLVQQHRAHVLGGLADGVAGGAEFAALGDRADLRGQVGHHRSLAPRIVAGLGQPGRQRLGQQEGPDGIGVQACFQVGLGHLAKALAAVQQAGVVDQQVDAGAVEHQRQFAQQFLAAARQRHIQRQYVQAPGILAGQRVQRGGAPGMAAGGHHPLPARQQLADELQAQAAIGPGHQAVARHGG